ncbi:33065_t:CDS:1, partial [Racocetra persica]
KADIFGTYYCENLRYNVELFFGEISGPSFYLNNSGKSHAIENQIKLGKCGKDSLEDFRRPLASRALTTSLEPEFQNYFKSRYQYE